MRPRTSSSVTAVPTSTAAAAAANAAAAIPNTTAAIANAIAAPTIGHASRRRVTNATDAPAPDERADAPRGADEPDAGVAQAERVDRERDRQDTHHARREREDRGEQDQQRGPGDRARIMSPSTASRARLHGRNRSASRSCTPGGWTPSVQERGRHQDRRRDPVDRARTGGREHGGRQQRAERAAEPFGQRGHRVARRHLLGAPRERRQQGVVPGPARRERERPDQRDRVHEPGSQPRRPWPRRRRRW